MTHTPERLRCSVCDMPTLGDTLCNLHYEEQEKMTHTPTPWHIGMKRAPIALNDVRNLEVENDIEFMRRLVMSYNAHDELVRVLKTILIWDDGNLPGDILEDARNVLAKAKEVRQ